MTDDMPQDRTTQTEDGFGRFPLPSPLDSEGNRRRLGVEIEFGGLEESEAAQLLQREAGGEIHKEETDYKVTDTRFGTCKLYMDTAYRKEASETEIGRAALDLARNFVPVELVTAPFDPARLSELDDFVVTLRRAGAFGTTKGILLGYGVHLNVQIREASAGHLWSVLTAFALTEPLLRRAFPINLSRRALPFVDPYPHSLRDALSRGPTDTVADLIKLYIDRAPSRNHALDMLPVFAHVDSTLVGQKFGSKKGISARPAYHYRMPDCRIDEEDWSLTQEWRRWVAIERLAEDRKTLLTLCGAWREHRLHMVQTDLDWAWEVARLMRRTGHDDLTFGTDGGGTDGGRNTVR